MTARWITADVFDGLATLDDGSVDLVVTSPPFLALRSYLPADHPDKSKEIGSEATPAEFIDTLLAVTAELRRVLAPHGSICVELGDTYSGSSMDGGDLAKLRAGISQQSSVGVWRSSQPIQKRGDPVQRQTEGWPLAKSRTLIPQLYEIALAYGINPLTGQPSPAGQWRIRNVVTWARPNPPVGALGDKWRPATSDVVVACTSGKRYWDDLATRRPDERFRLVESEPWCMIHDAPAQTSARAGSGFVPGLCFGAIGGPNSDKACEIDPAPTDEGQFAIEDFPHLLGTPADKRGGVSKGNFGGTDEQRRDSETRHMTAEHPAGAPLLDYWEIPPGGYKGAHYAVFPPALVEPLVKAMCPPKVCRECGEPSRRIVETTYDPNHPSAWGGRADWSGPRPDPESQRNNAGSVTAADQGRGVNPSSAGMRFGRAAKISNTTGWTDCGHDDYRPGLVLDPFAGSGTTLAVATGHGHDAIGIDLDPRNEDLARERIGPLLFEVSA